MHLVANLHLAVNRLILVVKLEAVVNVLTLEKTIYLRSITKNRQITLSFFYFTVDDGSYNGGDYSAIPGTPGVDYPIYTEIPKTSFDCKNQQFPGYYAGVLVFSFN